MSTSRQIVLGITGSIAAVKSVSLARALRDCGFAVRVAMSKGATSVITPQALRTVTQSTPYVDMWSPDDERGGERHIELAEWAQMMLIAPATASCLSSLALGFYDNCVTLVAGNLSPQQWLLAPAMAQAMWDQPPIQAHVSQLTSWGAKLIGPVSGPVASGATGQRLMEPDDLARFVDNGWDEWTKNT